MARKTSDEVWEQIKADYITKGTKPVALAHKYKVSKNSVYARAERENWDEKKGSYREETEKKLLESIQQDQVDDAKRMVMVSDKIMQRVEEILEMGHPKNMTPSGMKNLSETVLNIKNIKNMRSAEDIEEQKARIKKLQRDAEREDKNTSITINLEGVGDYAE